jgi:hypothetical protein
LERKQSTQRFGTHFAFFCDENAEMQLGQRRSTDGEVTV